MDATFHSVRSMMCLLLIANLIQHDWYGSDPSVEKRREDLRYPNETFRLRYCKITQSGSRTSPIRRKNCRGGHRSSVETRKRAPSLLNTISPTLSATHRAVSRPRQPHRCQLMCCRHSVSTMLLPGQQSLHSTKTNPTSQPWQVSYDTHHLSLP